MSQLSIVEAGPAPDPTLAQWFTPPWLAEELVALAVDANPRTILEPSAGRGNLVRAARARWPDAELHAIDLDARWKSDLFAAGADRVEIVDYLAQPAPAHRYDLAITNPPYDGGQEAAHLAKLLDECERVVALLPARSLHGRDRYERVWSRMANGFRSEWALAQVVHLVSRPAFGEKGGTDEIVLVDLVRDGVGFSGARVRWL